MKYISTTIATDWPKNDSWQVKTLKTIFFFIPKANPDYEHKIHLVKKWLIEFIEVENQLLPYREIGLDINGSLIIAGPDERNYGFWSDSNISFSDISGLEISKDNFESYWEKSNTIARPYYNKRHNK